MYCTVLYILETGFPLRSMEFYSSTVQCTVHIHSYFLAVTVAGDVRSSGLETNPGFFTCHAGIIKLADCK